MMADRTTKILLTAIALLLTGILVRPMLVPTPAQAQALNPHEPAQMIVDKGTVYVLENHNLTVYEVRIPGMVNESPKTKIDEVATTYVMSH